MTSERTDEELARAARHGDLEAFRTMVGRHQGRIYSLALRMVRDRSEAEDMAQEAFLRIYRGLGSFRGESSLSTWMTRVALNTYHRYLTRLPRTDPFPDAGESDDRPYEPPAGPDAGPDPEAGAVQADAARRLRALVASLSPQFREAVTTFYLQERSIDEAAKVLGIAVGTLKSRLFRAREMLLARWQETAGESVPLPALDAPRERHQEGV